MGTLSSQAYHDDSLDISKPVRICTDILTRTPVCLSQCIGQHEDPGLGLCHVFENGMCCRVIIDGEPVSPSWGITKAGNPRKRLAQACLTCRAKGVQRVSRGFVKR